jgi:hypothetical protein
VVVPAFKARALQGSKSYLKHIIHAVGPQHNFGDTAECEKYMGTVRNALQAAADHDCTYVALPLMGAKIFGWPADVAAHLLVRAVSQWVGSGKAAQCKRINLVDLDQAHAVALSNAVQEFSRNLPQALPALAPVQAPRRPQFVWSRYEHEIDQWIDYDYDQILQIENALPRHNFPVIIRGDSGGQVSPSMNIPEGQRSAVYAIEYGSPEGSPGFQHAENVFLGIPNDFPTHWYQINIESRYVRPVRTVDFEPPLTIFGYAETPQVVRVATQWTYASITDVVVDPKKQRLMITGTRMHVQKFQVALEDSLRSEEKSEQVSLERSFSVPWNTFFATLRAGLKAANIDATITPVADGTRKVILSAVGQLQLLEAKSYILERERELKVEEVEYPREWPRDVPYNPAEDGTTYVDVQKGSDEWVEKEALWRARNGGVEPIFQNTLLRMERVQNPAAWTAYVFRVRYLASLSRDQNPHASPFFKANEYWLKHGTRNTDPRVIAESKAGLDYRFSDANCLYGTAAYSAEDASYVDDYYSYTTVINGKQVKQMFLARVAAGRVHQVDAHEEAYRSWKIPPNNCDSVRGEVCWGGLVVRVDLCACVSVCVCVCMCV